MADTTQSPQDSPLTCPSSVLIVRGAAVPAVKYPEDYLLICSLRCHPGLLGHTLHLVPSPFCPRRTVESRVIIAYQLIMFLFILCCRVSGPIEGGDEFNVGFGKKNNNCSLWFKVTFQRELQGFCCCLLVLSQSKLLLFLSSPAVSIGPVGSIAAVPLCCLTMRMW